MIRLLHHGTGFGKIALRVDVVGRARKIAKDGASSHASPALTSMRMFGGVDEDLLLIDECLTPDSSRFWPKDEYTVGQSPPSFDKQFVRDYLETLDWDKTPPAPRLPKEVIEKSSAKYVEAFRRLTGSELADA